MSHALAMQREPLTRTLPWQTFPPRALEPLYASERERWASRYRWSTDEAWVEVERGRRLGTVGGFVAVDDAGHILGWTYFIVHHGVLQIGGLTAESAATTDRLLAALVDSAVGESAESILAFVPNDAPDVALLLEARGLIVESYDYLWRATSSASRHEGAGGALASSLLRRWLPMDATQLPAVLARAYPAENPARPFASRGSAGEWEEYVRQLIDFRGCGVFRQDCSFALVAKGGAGADVSGYVVVTDLGLGTAHIAQVVVDPDQRGCGYGRLLVEAACAGAAHAGFRRMSLFVGARNGSARQLYRTCGFVPSGSFTAAGSFSLAIPGRS